MEKNSMIVIIVAVIAIMAIGGYWYTTSASHPTYGPGTYKIGEDIAPGTYNRDGEAFVLNGHFISAGDIMVVDNSTGDVVVKSGNITLINDSTTYSP